VLRVGDRVVQTVNDYDRDVFNGDIGKVVDIITTPGLKDASKVQRKVVVKMDTSGRNLEYDTSRVQVSLLLSR
jgi:ATP-dependent exoDNAse (exonuclease V) alpha subunit